MSILFGNGRATNIGDDKMYNSMPMTENNPDTENKDFKNKAINNINQATSISNLFFSEININNLQNMIRYNIYKLSGQIIDRQSDTELKIVMRSYFLQYSKNSPDNLKEQLIDLNNHVLNYCVPKVHDEMIQFKGYINDVQNLPMPIERPKNMSSAGTKHLRSVTSTF